MAMPPTEVTQALELPVDAAVDMQHEFLPHKPELHSDSDEDKSSESPIFDSFYNGGGRPLSYKWATWNLRNSYIWAKIEASYHVNLECRTRPQIDIPR